MKTFIHSRDAVVSLWQSAVDATVAKSIQTASRPSSDHPLIAATNALVKVINDNLEAAGATGSSIPPPHSVAQAINAATPQAMAKALASLHPPLQAGGAPVLGSAAGGVVMDCAKLAFEMAQAKLFGDTAKYKSLEQKFDFGQCDPGWKECITQFLANAAIGGQNNIPYRKWNTLTDFVIDDPQVLLANARIGIVGDWGTGGTRAAEVVKQIAAHDPHVFIHLGDIYYSGTDAENQKYFSAICDAHLPPTTRRFTLAGNHDMYSAGAPYYRLLDRIQQPASYFCLRNKNWQLLALDTGFNDFNPFTVNDAVTSVQDSELVWHLDKIKNNDNRRTVLMSHHQLFSATGIGKAGPDNPKLFNQFGSVLDRITWWWWGHEHSHIIFDPYKGLQRGRCIGASAIPVDAKENPYEDTVANPPPIAPPRVSADSGLYDVAYAILRLNDEKAVLEHYQSQKNVPFFTETIV